MPNPPDQQRVDAFGQKMVDTLNHAGLSLMISIGHRIGLFDAMSRLTNSSSEQIAVEAKLSERYVREWLGAMVTGDVVDYSPDEQTYRLPVEHASWLTRAASPNNIAASMQWVAVLGSVENHVAEAFAHGRGVPYSEYGRFHEVMAEDSAQTVVAALPDHILPLVPNLVERLTQGINVLDVGCGSGLAVNELATQFPSSHFTGCDAAEAGIAAGNAGAAQRGITNVRFVLQDAAQMEAAAEFDLITAFDAIHDQAKPGIVLKNIAKALKPSGTFLMQDISGSGNVHADMAHPFAPFLYTISCMHCMSVSLAAGGPGLGAMWGRETAVRMLGEAGFDMVRVETLDHDPMNLFYIAKVST